MRKTARISVSVAAVCVLALGVAAAARAQQTTKKPAPATTARKSTGTTPAKPASAAALTTQKQKESYALGMNMGRGLLRQDVELDEAALMRGLSDTLNKKHAQLTDAEAEAALTQLEAETKQRIGDKNMKEGQEFLAANKTKEGVVALPDGLQYKILTAGNGPKPTADDTVVCNYSGTFINGTEFDSSYKRGQPAEFSLKGVIKGWTEALQLMPVGSKWQLFIPSDLAYGPQGRGPIPPNATLIFQVELLSIKGK
jgi:FKBP-type peptidyl-prolyl cis-trans isomerase FklB